MRASSEKHATATLAVARLVVTAGCGFLSTRPESRAAAYDYTFDLDAYGTLSNATIRAPLPAEDGTSVLNASVLAPNGTVDGAFDARVVDTEFGPMLELRAEEFVVEPRYFETVEEDGLGRRVSRPRSTTPTTRTTRRWRSARSTSS